jgi:hypothetical protein
LRAERAPLGEALEVWKDPGAQPLGPEAVQSGADVVGGDVFVQELVDFPAEVPKDFFRRAVRARRDVLADELLRRDGGAGRGGARAPRRD